MEKNKKNNYCNQFNMHIFKCASIQSFLICRKYRKILLVSSKSLIKYMNHLNDSLYFQLRTAEQNKKVG